MDEIFATYDLQDLFKIRDALDILAQYELHDNEILHAVNQEIQVREQKGGE